jgi:hypothetical protein
MSERMKKVVSSVFVIAILCVSTLLVFNYITTPFSWYPNHYERQMSDSETVHLYVKGLQDCILTIEYEQNENLMYRIKAELYDSSETLTVEYHAGSYVRHQVNINPGLTTRAKFVNITLGTGHPYYVMMGASNDNSRNVTGNIFFDNNATIGGQTYTYYMPGSLNLEFTENVDHSQGGLDIDVGSYNFHVDSVLMNIDLPDGMDGDATFNSEGVSISISGWTLYHDASSPPVRSYRTSSNSTKPLLTIDHVYASSILATLMI